MNKTCLAISSLCNDNQHILMLDIDENISLEEVLMYCTPIINKYNLSDIYVINSTKGYNLFSLDKLPFNFIKMIGQEFPIFDKQFLVFGYRRGYYDLRLGVDKKYITKVDGNKYVNKSNAHRLFFNWFFDLNIENDAFFDHETKIGIVEYESEKYGYIGGLRVEETV